MVMLLHALKAYGHPSPFGRQIYENPTPISLHAKVNHVYHGTSEFNLGTQPLREGKFPSIGRPIYFSRFPDNAAYFVRDAENPLLLELASCSPVKKDRHFNEWYFCSGPDQKVWIVNAWQVSQEFIYYLYHQSEYSDPQLIEKLKSVARAIFQ